MTDASDTVITFKERAGKPGGGKGILIGYDAAFTLATECRDSICYEEPVTETEMGGGYSGTALRRVHGRAGTESPDHCVLRKDIAFAQIRSVRRKHDPGRGIPHQNDGRGQGGGMT